MIMMLSYSDEELIEGLKHRKNSTITYMYQEWFPPVRNHLLHNSGNQQDGEDLFQDTLLALYIRIREKPLLLECSLKTYFIAVCRNIWLQRLERKQRVIYQASCEVHEDKATYTLPDFDPNELELEQQRLFYRNLMKLPNQCIQLLKLYCLKVPYKEIARMLKLKDEITVKIRKYNCKNMLRKNIINDPESLLN